MKNILKRLSAILLILCLLPTISCGTPTEKGGEDETKKPVSSADITDTLADNSDETPTETPNLVLVPGQTHMTSAMIPLRNNLMDYYLAMFKDIVADGSKNVVFSPYSVFAATAMATEGAKGQTLEELEALMGVSQEDLAAAYGLYLGEYGKASGLLTANSIWVDTYEGLMINQDTFDRLQASYGAGAFHKDLQSPETVAQLNKWISEHTKGRIPQMIDKLSETSRLALVNALSLDAEWYKPYSEYQQKEGKFTNVSGSTTPVTMLTSMEDYYIEDENATGFYKRYRPSEDGKRYAFVAILPREGMTPAEYLSTLDGDGLRNILFNYTRNVDLYTKLPVFKADAAYELSETYQRLGCVTPFTRSADFTGLADNPLCIGTITHKAMIEVDALGTKAGAATVIDMPESAAPMDPLPVKEVYLDRPFIYMILDCDTGLPVFMGMTANIS